MVALRDIPRNLIECEVYFQTTPFSISREQLYVGQKSMGILKDSKTQRHGSVFTLLRGINNTGNSDEGICNSTLCTYGQQ